MIRLIQAAFQAYREWKAARAYRRALRFFDKQIEEARRRHASVKPIVAARRDWMCDQLRGGPVA